jgi:FtsP/CotA-like multicopper oxidase with cupredoxin domain
VKIRSSDNVYWMCLRVCLFMAALFAVFPTCSLAQRLPADPCPRPAPGSIAAEPEDLRSQNGVLRVELTFRNIAEPDGTVRYCYVSKDGHEAPTLRLSPGDELILRLKNELTPDQRLQGNAKPSAPPGVTLAIASQHGSMRMLMRDPCASGEMTSVATNLHFHGINVPPVCHQDDVLNTMIQPGDPAFEYRFKIPADEPPGLYWYHPHVHGLTKTQVLGGASGAMIIEGIERANHNLAGLPERVLIVRDQDLMNPNAGPVQSDSAKMPPIILDAEGDVMNTGTGTGKPAKDLSLNFVPVPYPDYPPSVISMKAGEKQLWRVLNACAITYLNLQVLFGNSAQQLGVVAVDGAPINENGLSGNRAIWVNHVGIPPGGRIEFIVQGPAAGVKARLVTRGVNTGPAGENDPSRPLANIVASEDGPEPQAVLAKSPNPLPPAKTVWLGDVTPVRTRKLYFSETPQDPNDPNSPTTFYITVDGQTPKAFDPSSAVPNIVVHQGDVEDWIIENRTQELHAFHIHQVHFMLLAWYGLPVDEPFLRDTINVPFWDGKSEKYPMVRLRMDFRDPNAVGTFVYHCHLLEHEDGGMMGLIRVVPREQAANRPSRAIPAGVRLCGAPQSHRAAIVAAANRNENSQRN